jgi:hypothetical protein
MIIHDSHHIKHKRNNEKLHLSELGARCADELEHSFANSNTSRGLRSSGMLRGVFWQLVTDAEG